MSHWAWLDHRVTHGRALGTRAAGGGVEVTNEPSSLPSVVQTRADPLFCGTSHAPHHRDPAAKRSRALTRVAGLVLYARLQHRIPVGRATDDPTVSRLTLVTSGSDQVIHQIRQPAEQAGGRGERARHDARLSILERELVLLKLKLEPAHTDAVRGQVYAAAAACSIRRWRVSSSSSPRARRRSTASSRNSAAAPSCSRWYAAARSALAAEPGRCGARPAPATSA